MTSSYVFSMFCLLSFKSFTPCRSECAELESYAYMNFVVRVWDFGQKLVWSTGSIVTPNVVMGICTRDLSPEQDLKEIRTVLHASATDFRIRVSSARLPKNKTDKTPDRPHDILSHHFSQGLNGVPEDAPHVCSGEYEIKTIFPHPWCQDKKIFQPSKWNFAAFVTKVKRFSVKEGDLMPLLPISEDLQNTMQVIDRFNSKRRARCQLAQFYAEMSRSDAIRYQFKNQNAYASVSMNSECSTTVCYEKYHQEDEDRENTAKQDYCKYLMTEPEGTMFCATRVNQEHFLEGMDYYDYENKDKEFDFAAAAKEETEQVDENKCAYNLDIILGAPMMCEGTVIGFVVMCHKRTLIFSSTTTIRNFLLYLINSSYLPTIYMDATEKASVRSFPDPTSDTSFQSVHQQKLKMDTHSSTSPLTHYFLMTTVLSILSFSFMV